MTGGQAENPFGLRDGIIVHVSQVESGLACECRCAFCDERLIARKGAIRAHHFAHESGHQCAHALETALHLAAKAILERERVLELPADSVTVSETDASGRLHVLRAELPAQKVTIDEVRAEKRLGRIVPDLYAVVKGYPLLIEIAVTHLVDEEKRRWVVANDCAMIEIDLTDIERAASMEEVREAVVESTWRKDWIHHPSMEKRRAALERELAERISEANSRRPAIPNAPSKDDLWYAWRKQCQANLRNDAHPDPAQEGPFSAAWAEIRSAFGSDLRALPLALPYSVLTDQGAFRAPALLWQSAVFLRFVYRPNSDRFTHRDVETWCQRQRFIDPLFVQVRKALPGGSRKDESRFHQLPDPESAIDRFLLHLADEGLLDFNGEAFSVTGLREALSRSVPKPTPPSLIDATAGVLWCDAQLRAGRPSHAHICLRCGVKRLVPDNAQRR